MPKITRHTIEPVLFLDGENAVSRIDIKESQNGEWIKWSDFEDYIRAINQMHKNNQTIGLESSILRDDLVDSRLKLNHEKIRREGAEGALTHLRSEFEDYKKKQKEQLWMVHIGEKAPINVATAEDALRLNKYIYNLNETIKNKIS